MCLPNKRTSDIHVASSPPSSGFEKNRRKIEYGLLAMSVIYGLVLAIDPPISAATKYCDSPGTDASGECRRPDLLAYKVTAVLSMIVMGGMGVYNWHFSQRIKELAQKTTTPEERMFGYLPAADNQNVVMFCYQVWDFCVSLTIPEHREVIFLVHHFLAGVTSWFSLEYQMVPYYCIFYAGCSELSSIFLVFADADEFFPPTAPGEEGSSSAYGLFLESCKGLFVMTFFFYRVYGWIRMSFPLWEDTLHVLRTGSAEKQRPGRTGFLYVFLCLNVLLGALQLFWFGQIIQKIVEVVQS